MRKGITIVVAMDFNGAIGRNNGLLCTLKDDMALFKRITEHNVVVMGRKTFESIGKPLPNRINVILTRDDSKTEYYRSLGCFVCHSVDEVIANHKSDKEMFIIGGAEIYKQFLPIADNLIVSRIESFFDDADTFFPIVDWEEWTPLGGTGIHYKADDRNEYPFTLYGYYRK